MFQNKKFYLKVYKFDGTFITTWASDVINSPSFKAIINGGLSELKIQLARTFSSIDENDANRDVNFVNEVKLYIVDKEAPNGLLIYDGYISDYSPILREDQEYIEVICLGYVADLESNDFVDTNGNTAIEYISQDPGYIIRDILARNVGKITGDASTVLDTGTVISYIFNNSNVLSAIDKTREMSLELWYWFVGADNKLVFRRSSSTPDHVLFIEKDITAIDTFKSVRDLKNVVKFLGGISADDPANPKKLFKVYERVPSIASYGRRIHYINDERVLYEATADLQANKFLDENENPFVRATVEVLDSNGDDKSGFDIESLKPGDTVQIVDPRFPPASQPYSFSEIFVIQSVQYEYDKAVLELSVRAPWMPIQLQKQIKQLLQERNATAPIHPWGTGADTIITPIQSSVFGRAEQPGSIRGVMIPASGVSGTFKSGDTPVKKDITIVNGIVTNIA